MMNIKFKRVVPKKMLSVSTAGLIIPNITSTAVTIRRIQNTLQIHQVP